jgi:hypothetical protein
MVWFELAGRAAEIVIKISSESAVKAASEQATKDALSKKRRFAKDLFSFYEDLKQYRALCDKALSILQRGPNWVKGGLTFGASKELGAMSNQMKKIGGSLFAGFFRDGLEELSPTRELTLVEVQDRNSEIGMWTIIVASQTPFQATVLIRDQTGVKRLCIFPPAA